MGRPAKAIRPIEKKINIPEDLTVQVDLILWSELEQRVPHGAWSRYIISLIEDDLKRKAEHARKSER